MSAVLNYLYITYSNPCNGGPNSGCPDLLSKIGRREEPSSIPGRAYRPSRSEFSVIFSETRVNTD